MRDIFWQLIENLRVITELIKKGTYVLKSSFRNPVHDWSNCKGAKLSFVETGMLPERRTGKSGRNKH